MDSRSSHPHFYEFARDVIGSQGLAPGFPQQFAYVERKNHPTQATPAYVNIHVNGDTGILQNGVKTPIIGHYRSMVEDVPWDPKFEAKSTANRAAFGLGAIAVGTLLL
jgi:hypothetical protein